jgi:GNAT superfamily N-acetyltransferase
VKVMEIGPGQAHRAHRAMRELRPGVGDAEAFTALVDGELRPGGYRLVGVFEDPEEDATAAAGFRVGRSLAWGRYLYVDDLVSLPRVRGRGHGRALLDWLRDRAREEGCGQVHLDSGTARHGAHRFYLAAGMVIPAFHFTEVLDD